MATRTVRDLREIVCVSRLTCRDTDDDDDDGLFYRSDDDDEDRNRSSVRSSSSSASRLSFTAPSSKSPASFRAGADASSSGVFSSAGSSSRRRDFPTGADAWKAAVSGVVSARQQFLLESLAETRAVPSTASSAPTLRLGAGQTVWPRPPSGPRPPSTGSLSAGVGSPARAARIRLTPLMDASKKNTMEDSCRANNIASAEDSPLSVVSAANETDTTARTKKKKKKKKKKSTVSDSAAAVAAESSDDEADPKSSVEKKPSKRSLQSLVESRSSSSSSEDIDAVLDFVDSTVVSDWLTRANDLLSSLCDWSLSADNFVFFAQFWLTELSDADARHLLEMERGILLDEFNLAFKSGLDSGRVGHAHLETLLRIAFSEFPSKLCGPRFGRTNFLNILQALSLPSTDAHLELLTNVRHSTRNSVHAQWLLSLRAFAIVGVWSNVVRFFERLRGGGGSGGGGSGGGAADSSRVGAPAMTGKLEGETRIDVISVSRAVQAVHLGFVPVLKYLLYQRYISPHMVDHQGRSLPFLAVLYNRASVLKFLLKLPTERVPDLNRSSATGNTPLHAAANLARAELVERLLEHPLVDPSVVNAKCDGSTPLHVAVMHGHTSIVRSLLKAGANPSLKMGDMTPLQLAREMAADDVVAVFKSFGVEF